jgi:flagellar biosynthesis/type III secretory pathway M-ring protein FliF/YscJ
MVRQKTDLRIHEEISVLQKKLSETDIQLTEEKKVSAAAAAAAYSMMCVVVTMWIISPVYSTLYLPR